MGRLGLIAALTVLASSAGAEDGWTPDGESRGATFQKRAVPGSSYDEFRASIDLAVSPAAAAATVWKSAADPTSTKTVRKKVLASGPDEVVVYQQISVSTVSDRDMTLRLWRLPPAADGTVEVRWATANDRGPGPEEGFVRMTDVRGSWTVKPLPGGKTRLVFVTFSDPAGSVPAMFVRGPQRDRAALDFWNVVKKLQPKQ